LKKYRGWPETADLIEAATVHGFAVLRFPFRDGGIPENIVEAVR
jgi:hypothetical protein